MRLRDDLVQREPSPWVTKQEAAEYLRCTPHTIDGYAKQGLLQRYHVAGWKTTRFKRADLDALVRPVAPIVEPEQDPEQEP